MAQIDNLLRTTVSEDASDLHLSAGTQPHLRKNGDLEPFGEKVLDNKQVQDLVFEILTEKQKRMFVENWELDCSYALPGVGRFRVNVFIQGRGVSAVLRVIPEEVKSVRELNLPQPIRNLINVSRGLVLITGPTGSGKSTTLASLIHEINTQRSEHIITIEEPIEFVHQSKKALVNQRELHSHTKSFSNALKSALREDPDVILVGEMRDLETIELAITAAETGHLVFGTLHTNDAPSTVERVIDVFPSERQEQIRNMLSGSLRGVVAQTLFKRIDKPGRIAAFEVLKNTSAISNLIREGKTFQIRSTMELGKSQGMISFEDSLSELVNSKVIEHAQAERFLGRPLRVKASGTPPSSLGKSPMNKKPPSPQEKQTPKSAGETTGLNKGFGFKKAN